MKKQVAWIWLLVCILALAACEKPVLDNVDEGTKSHNSKNKLTRVVRIHPKELHIETFEDAMGAKPQPFSRGVTGEAKKKFYAVNVYEKKPNEETYSMYAYGLFTNASKIALKMNVENLYKVECLIVEEGDDRIFLKDGEYLAPFLHGTDKGTRLTNSFVLSKEENLNGLTKGETTIADGRTIHYPRITKLYATIDSFSPKATKDLTLDMKRSVFGLHFKVTPPDEGKLVVNYVGWGIPLTKDSPMYDNRAVYSFYDVVNGTKDGYQTTIDLRVSWTKDDGTVEKEQKQLTIKRNVMSVIDISVEGKKPQGFTFHEESGDMETENTVWKLVL
ncbi:hypothetical protein [Prevotella jejuni]